MLPDFLVDHFEVVSTNNTEEILHLYFEEKIKPPKEFNTLELVSKGFQDEITIQDFPLRGNIPELLPNGDSVKQLLAEVGTCFINLAKNGLSVKTKELKCYLCCIPI